MNKYLIDAQLPRKLKYLFQENELDAVHTLDLTKANTTSDHEINLVSIEEERIVVTKDADFVDSFLLTKYPYKLLLVSTGNIRNQDLIEIFEKRITEIDDLFKTCEFLELNHEFLVIHENRSEED